MSTNDERQRLLDLCALDVRPAPKLVLADWLEEHGKPGPDLDLAYAMRWMAARGNRPHCREDVVRYPWVWCLEGKATRRDHKLTYRMRKRFVYCCLPGPVFLALPDLDAGDKVLQLLDFPSAVEYLACAVAIVRRAGAIDPKEIDR